MKKTLLFLSIVGALASCKKNDTGDNTNTPAAKLVITGKAFANLDISDNDFDWELVPAGTKVTAFVPLNDLRLKADTNLNGRYASFSTSVLSDGTYTISFGAPDKQVAVTLVYDDFAYDQLQPSTSATSTKREVFKHGNTLFNVYGGTTTVDDAYWYFVP